MPSDGPAAPRLQANSLETTTILILDDSVTVRVALASTLKAAGCRSVIETGNGHEALRMVAQQQIDLILCDCQMPAMPGLEFLAALRAMPGGAAIPVLMLTVNDDPEDVREARRLGVSGWLMKPMAPQAVAAQVALTLDR